DRDGPMDELIFRVLKGGATAQEMEAVRVWRETSPENEAHYRQLVQVLAVTSQVESASRQAIPPAAVEIINRAASPTLRNPSHGRWRLSWVVPLATAAAMLLGFLGSKLLPARAPAVTFAADEFVTGPADMATVRLNDGTVVRLAPRSRLRVISGRNSREVTLDGHACFAVAKARGM